MGGEYIESEDAIIGRSQPIRKRRLFQVTDAIHFQGDPVAAAGHILGGSRVGSVGVIQQGRSEERRHMDRGEHQQQQASRSALERGQEYSREAPQEKGRSDSTWLIKAQ